jgi:uncharacterized SAM-binding protein YcdF (DUF218 family)
MVSDSLLKRVTKPTIVLMVFLLAVFVGCGAGRFLVVTRVEQADAIVVLAGDHDDRYYKGLELLREGYAPLMFLDANADDYKFGFSANRVAREFIRRTAGGMQDRVQVCPITGDSTQEETQHVAACLQRIHANHVLLVTSDFHTRRAFSIFSQRLPTYCWAVAASTNNSDFGMEWWRNREWAKSTLLEWTKLGWWELVDRWSSPRP